MRIMLPFGSISCIRFNGYNLNSMLEYPRVVQR